MGLIKKQLQYKGFTLTNAYARVQVNTEQNTATFFIGANRELAFSDPITKVTINVDFSHSENPLKEAYVASKKPIENVIYDRKTNKYITQTVNSFFQDWTDIDV